VTEDDDVQAYVVGMQPATRTLFDRLHAIVLQEPPEAEVALSYGMPGYRLGRRWLNIGAWAHGISLCGWRKDNDGGFVARHPRLASGKATLRIVPPAQRGSMTTSSALSLGARSSPERSSLC
jgi:hypothetical protein